MSNPWRCNQFITRGFATIGGHTDKQNEREYGIASNNMPNLVKVIESCQAKSKRFILVIQDLMGNRTIVNRIGWQTLDNKRFPGLIYTDVSTTPIARGTFVEFLCLPLRWDSSMAPSASGNSSFIITGMDDPYACDESMSPDLLDCEIARRP